MGWVGLFFFVILRGGGMRSTGYKTPEVLLPCKEEEFAVCTALNLICLTPCF